MNSKFLLSVSAIVLTAAFALYAKEPSELEAAKQEYEKAAHDGEDAARARYVNKLSQMLSRLIAEKQSRGRYENIEYWNAIFAELKRHPLPINSDPQSLSKLIVGKWESPRRIYEYRPDGLVVSDASSDRWRIEGNDLFKGDQRYLLLVLDRSYLVFTDGEAVFHHTRVSPDD